MFDQPITIKCFKIHFLSAVVFDQTGTSKCYGFVRFGNEQEQQTALATMINAVGLGGKPIKVINISGN